MNLELKSPVLNIQEGFDAIKWQKFKQAFEIYVNAIDVKLENGKQICSLMLYSMGEEGLDIYNTFELKKEEQNNFDVLVSNFDKYFLPKINITYERHKFF